MVSFTAEIFRFENKGEKSGWSYIDVPVSLAQQLKPGCHTWFRVKGTIGGHPFAGIALVPMGEGNFILPVNGGMRRILQKKEGDVLQLSLEEDTEFRIEIPEDLEVCLLEDERLHEAFMNLTKSHRNYFINHINQAKTEETRTRRIVQAVEAMDLGIDFGAMIRRSRQHKDR